MNRVALRVGASNGATLDVLRVDGAERLELVVSPSGRVTLGPPELRDLVDAIRDELHRFQVSERKRKAVAR